MCIHRVGRSIKWLWEWVAQTFSSTLKASFVAALTLVLVHFWVAPSAQRHQKRLDEKYSACTDVATIRAEYYQAIWNFYFGIIRKEDAVAMRVYREKLQGASVKAEALAIRLGLFFSDPNVASDWQRVEQAFHDAHYPLGRPEMRSQITGEYEKKLNEDLKPVEPLMDSLLARMQKEL